MISVTHETRVQFPPKSRRHFLEKDKKTIIFPSSPSLTLFLMLYSINGFIMTGGTYRSFITVNEFKNRKYSIWSFPLGTDLP